MCARYIYAQIVDRKITGRNCMRKLQVCWTHIYIAVGMRDTQRVISDGTTAISFDSVFFWID